MSTMIQKVLKEIEQHDKFLITTHVKPDGDAIGSLLATAEVLEQAGKNVELYCQDTLTHWQNMLPGAHRIHNQIQSPLDTFEAAIILDCGDLSRIGEYQDGIATIPVLINIDHHLTEKPFTELRLGNTSASSTSELLFDLFDTWNIRWTPSIATNLYVGIFTDTGSFRFSNTTERCFEMASFLVNSGAKPAEIAQNIYGQCHINRLKLLCLVLNTLELVCDGKISHITASQEMFAKTDTSARDTEDFINFPRSLRGIKIAIFFREEKNGLINVSLRSLGEVNVARFAGEFDGGGHWNAAACRFRNSSLDNVKREILRAGCNYLMEYE